MTLAKIKDFIDAHADKLIIVAALLGIVWFVWPSEDSTCVNMFCFEVVEQQLKDGTRCAVMVGDYKGGISCDWRASTKPDKVPN